VNGPCQIVFEIKGHDRVTGAYGNSEGLLIANASTIT
jgi:hypothetical protein